MPLVIGHVFPTSLGGKNALNNLAAACYRCNEFKGAKTSGRDPLSEESADLFHPRIQLWPDHFIWTERGLYIKGKTAIAEQPLKRCE